ncbi:hypothetical protein DVH05_024469 [Phytophthora capsici]|nr:hypothetical protein DVH05_024469 [Phytophthora capsici]
MELEGGDDATAAACIIDGVTAALPSDVSKGRARQDSVDVADGVGDDGDDQAVDMTESLRSELLQLIHPSEPGSGQGSMSASTSIVSCDGRESVTAVCGSITEQDKNEDDHVDDEDDDIEDEEAVTVASVFAETNSKLFE